MNATDRGQLVNQLKRHCATKQFDPQCQLSLEDWAALAEVFELTPSGTAGHCNNGARR